MDRRKDHETALAIEIILNAVAEYEVEEAALVLIDCGIDPSLIARLIKTPEMRRQVYQHGNLRIHWLH